MVKFYPCDRVTGKKLLIVLVAITNFGRVYFMKLEERLSVEGIILKILKIMVLYEL